MWHLFSGPVLFCCASLNHSQASLNDTIADEKLPTTFVMTDDFTLAIAQGFLQNLDFTDD
jgi:hypothetical protein